MEQIIISLLVGVGYPQNKSNKHNKHNKNSNNDNSNNKQQYQTTMNNSKRPEIDGNLHRFSLTKKPNFHQDLHFKRTCTVINASCSSSTPCINISISLNLDLNKIEKSSKCLKHPFFDIFFPLNQVIQSDLLIP